MLFAVRFIVYYHFFAEANTLYIEKFYENCKKIIKKSDTIFNGMQKIQFLKKQAL